MPMKFPELQQLSLCNKYNNNLVSNSIGSEGCKLLIKTSMPSLEKLFVCNLLLI
jgi:hypothetical protein